jgi:hypothetical protein
VEVVATLSQGRIAAAQSGLAYKSVPVIFEPPCNSKYFEWFQPTLLGGQTFIINDLTMSFFAHRVSYICHILPVFCSNTQNSFTNYARFEVLSGSY